MSNEVPQLDRAFAQLVADAMQPHLKRAVDDAVHEYMGQNGDQHRKDHAEIAEQRREAKARIEAEEEARREAKVEAAERKRFRRVVMSGVIVAVVGTCLNVLGKVFGWY